MRRSCEWCGRPYEAESKRSRFCSGTCRSRAHRGAAVRVRPVEDAPTLVAVTRRQLEAASRADTPAGVSALLLAARLDAGGDTGSAIAALSKQHLTALADALADAPSPDDAVDEARARRQKRLRA